ncbi:MAG: hypothetical protein IJ635_02505 [Bacteroidaceae bacterium]|nr:hypothetical protein [Bacteroidaceae bacterium]
MNISFLFPFFLFGYYTKNISQIGWKRGLLSMSFFVLLLVCVWHPQYSIWNSGGYILQNTEYMIKVVLLRLMIGMAGIYTTIFVMGRFYDKYKGLSILNLFVGIGKETLSIYLLQHIVVEIGFLRLARSLYTHDFLTENHLMLGYVVAPVVSFILLYVMYKVICIVQKHKSVKWLFGFKLSV